MRAMFTDSSTIEYDTECHEEADDELMSVKQYNLLKLQLRKTLQNRSDPYGVVLSHGVCTPERSPSDCLRNALEETRGKGGRLQRGYKLYCVSLKGDVIGFRAAFHIVIAYGSGANAVYVDHCPACCEENQGKRFVFMPSSRAHVEIRDDELLNDGMKLGIVIGGHPDLVDYVREVVNSGTGHRVVGTTPEECIASKRSHIVLPCYFEEWASARDPDQPHMMLAEIMCMPVMTLDGRIVAADEDETPDYLGPECAMRAAKGMRCWQECQFVAHAFETGICDQKRCKARIFALLDAQRAEQVRTFKKIADIINYKNASPFNSVCKYAF